MMMFGRVLPVTAVAPMERVNAPQAIDKQIVRSSGVGLEGGAGFGDSAEAALQPESPYVTETQEINGLNPLVPLAVAVRVYGGFAPPRIAESGGDGPQKRDVSVLA